jgi:release factor-specific protein-(glutamine-N5) methyltransferase
MQKSEKGMRLEYISGRAEFMGLTFLVSPDTLIPRQETELLVRVVLRIIEERQKIQDSLTIIDMGTGCGNIAITLAINTKNTRILGSDISSSAIAIAQKNVNRFNLQQRISLLSGDLFSGFQGMGYEGKIDLIVFNPPYISTGKITRLSNEITDYEPLIALDGGPYGLNFHLRTIKEALPFLKPKGILALEIGLGQEKQVIRLFERSGSYKNISTYSDNEGQVRVITAEKNI